MSVPIFSCFRFSLCLEFVPPGAFWCNSLAGRLAARDLGLGESLGGPGRVLDSLGEDSESTLGVGDDTDGLYFFVLACILFDVACDLHRELVGS
jgi:hypothetical protein